MRILFIAGREPDYIRNKVILKGLRENGVEILECTSLSGSYLTRLPAVIKKWFGTLWRRETFDAVFVGFLGHPLVPIVKKTAPKKPIIFDVHSSFYDTLVKDRGRFKDGSIMSRLLQAFDRYSCSLADKVFLDTYEHANYFRDQFDLEPELFERTLVGADDLLFYPREKDPGDVFTVHFQGGGGGMLLPLHGFPYILKAAKLLEDRDDIKFNMICSVEDFGYDSLIEELNPRNVDFIGMVPAEEVPEVIARADLCLGVFGSTPKAQRVIPGKVYEALAMGKPVITARTPAIAELLTDRVDVFLCDPASPESLAEAILTLKNDKKLMNDIAQQGYRKYRDECTPEVIGKRLKEVLKRVIEEHEAE